MSWTEFFRRFREIALEGVDRWLLGVEILLLPGLIPSVRNWLARASGMWILNTNEFWMTLLFLGGAALILRTTKRMIESNQAKVEREKTVLLDEAKSDFYKVNFNAKRERGHYLFYRLYLEGQSQLAGGSGSSETWQRWDQQVRAAMIDYCSHNILYAYLMDTDRLGDRIDNPVSPDYYQCALECIRYNVLDTTIQNVFK